MRIMEFKNINQLKKEIEKFKKKREEQGDIYIDDAFVDGGKIRTLIALKDREAKLQTLQKVCEEIEKEKNKQKIWINLEGDDYIAGCDNPNETEDGGSTDNEWVGVIPTTELLKKFQGEEK